MWRSRRIAAVLAGLALGGCKRDAPPPPAAPGIDPLQSAANAPPSPPPPAPRCEPDFGNHPMGPSFFVEDCRRAVAAAGQAERPALEVALARLLSRWEKALCDGCRFSPHIDGNCDSFEFEARGDPETWRPRQGGYGYALTGRTLQRIVETRPDSPEARAAREVLAAIAAAEAEPEAAHCAARRNRAALDRCKLRSYDTFRDRGGLDEYEAFPDTLVRDAIADCLGQPDPPSADTPDVLLAQGRLLRGYQPAFCTSLSRWSLVPAEERIIEERERDPSCDVFQTLVASRPDFYEITGEGANRYAKYNGWHFAEVVRRFPAATEADDARCLLARTKEPGRAWERPACAPILARTPPGPCPERLPEGADPVQTARRCEAAARAAPPPDRAKLLLAAARLFRSTDDQCRDRSCPGFMELVREREDLFAWNELGGRWRYDGRHYALLLERYPDAPEADDALWEHESRALRGECEGEIDCYLERGLEPVATYVARYPRGRRLKDATDVALESLRMNLREYGPGRRSRDETQNIRHVLPRYEKLAERLPADLAEPMTEAIGAWWEALGDPARAKRLRARAPQATPPSEDRR